MPDKGAGEMLDAMRRRCAAHGQHKANTKHLQSIWQGKKDSNLRMLESKSSALTNLATPLRWIELYNDFLYPISKLAKNVHLHKGAQGSFDHHGGPAG